MGFSSGSEKSTTCFHKEGRHNGYVLSSIVAFHSASIFRSELRTAVLQTAQGEIRNLQRKYADSVYPSDISFEAIILSSSFGETSTILTIPSVPQSLV